MLVDLLRESKPSGPDHLLHHFDEYARLVVDTVFSVSRDIKELKYLVGYGNTARLVRRHSGSLGARELAKSGFCNRRGRKGG